MKRQEPRPPTALPTSAKSIPAPLTLLDLRLLQWVGRYPAVTLEDLAVAVARWNRSGKVKQRIGLLMSRGLLEYVTLASRGKGKRRFYILTARGLTTLAGVLHTSPCRLADAWGTGEQAVLRLLPRLSALSLAQAVVSGLIAHAPTAFANPTGLPDILVRWEWQRQYCASFTASTGASQHLEADASLVLCVRHNRGALQEREQGQEDAWYCLLLFVDDGLNDIRRIRDRLTAVMHFCESPQRRLSPDDVFTVVVLTASRRRCDHWLRVASEVTRYGGHAPLCGVVTCLSAVAQAQALGNPWCFSWKNLATREDCRLNTQLLRLPQAALPPGTVTEVLFAAVQAGMVADEPLSRQTASTGTHTRLTLTKGRYLARAHRNHAWHEQGRHKEAELLAWLGLLLGPRPLAILDLLTNHPFLSGDEVATLEGISTDYALRSLHALRRLGCLSPEATSCGSRWQLSSRGLRFQAARHQLSCATIASVVERAASRTALPRLAQRGAANLVRLLEHTVGIYRFFITLQEAAHRSPFHELCWWETKTASQRRFRVEQRWSGIVPDAQAEYRVGEHTCRFWFEWDRGTMNERDLTIKFAAYARYVASRWWQGEQAGLPFLLIVTADYAQERRIARVVETELAETVALVVRSTTVALLSRYGPLAPIWWQVWPQATGPSGRIAFVGDIREA